MSDFDDLAGEVQSGMDGNNSGIPMGFKRLNNHISIRKSTKYLIGGYTGCLTGDSIVEIGRKQRTANTKRYTLEYVYNQLRGNVKKDKWNLSLPTRIKCFKPDQGQTGLQEIEDVIYSGEKEVYEIRTNTGKVLRATKDHKFMVNEKGDFKRLEELQKGDVVVCKSLPHPRAKGRKIKTSNFGYSWIGLETIVSISYIGIRETFDVICKDPYHNFIANGFVVHNSGKTALLDDAFVLNPLDWYIRNYNDTNIRLKLVYWSMERRKNFKLAKWVSRKIFLDHGVIIPVTRLMGWCPRDQRLTSDEHDLFMLYRDYVEALMDVIIMIDGPDNPTGMRKFMRELYLQNGKEEQVTEHKRVYIPNNPNLIVIKIKDHSGLLKKEAGLGSKKEVIDKSSEDDRMERDYYGGSIVEVSQFNRDISSPLRLKSGDVEPMLEDFKDTGSTQEDADVVLSLFDPMRYKVPDPSGYDLAKLRNNQGHKMYRSLKILKNSYGSDDIRIGLAMQPVIGLFKEMPKVDTMSPEIYDSILENTYFLPEEN